MKCHLISALMSEDLKKLFIEISMCGCKGLNIMAMNSRY